ncbi:MAG TPA: CHASE3 domain-containing protein, partial [Longimicrobiaceae bacterium]|nr:CHASE3 domain-containing protein [Longimicrobiaceae bacterium]
MRLRTIPTVTEAAKLGGMPAAVVLIALVALLLVPIPLRERAASVRAELDTYAQPADDQLAEIQYLLARQNSALRGFFISGDSAYLDDFAAFAAAERALYPALEANAARLTPPIAADVAELQTLSAQWHERLRIDLATVDGIRTPALATFEQEIYRGSLEAAARATQSLRSYTRGRQDDIDRAERQMQAIYILLFLVAAAAALAVVVLNSRIRRLAREANARRAEAERAMRQTERAVAARSDLIRGFTHDVKNPLGVADGFAELLEL